MKTLMLASLLLLAGCASMGGAGAPPVDVKGADVSRRTMDNGDVIEEYRVSGQLRMVKVTPSRGAPFYMYDKKAGPFQLEVAAIEAVNLDVIASR